ncbi:unnamed protein product [Aureobasidium pullulans]|nr:unnamed protein product [Aureobasidium pullulans]
MAAFHFQAERFSQARDLFQTALNACVKAGAKDSELDTDSLVTSISYNLARTYEAENMLDEANQVYQGLLERHPDYTDARIRLAYIALRENPSEGAQAVKKLLESEPGNLDIRALYGHYIHKAKKRTMNPAEDQEQRHYKHTLQHHDKHDRYSLTGMGNLFLQVAREMRRDTDQDKEKRTKTYVRAIEFFDKALQLDPRNAYAAQGIAIALIEDKKDYGTAIQVFSKVRETLKDTSVFINMGHAFVEVKQFARAIENYEAALAKDRTHDPSILACLGRVWLMKGKQEKSLQAIKTALEFSNRALESSPEQLHFKFNVAFVQIQIAQLIYTLPEATRTLVDLEAAANGLDEAIESLMAIARSPNPPFPKTTSNSVPAWEEIQCASSWIVPYRANATSNRRTHPDWNKLVKPVRLKLRSAKTRNEHWKRQRKSVGGRSLKRDNACKSKIAKSLNRRLKKKLSARPVKKRTTLLMRKLVVARREKRGPRAAKEEEGQRQ